MNYTIMTTDEEARITKSMAKIRNESAALTESLKELKGFLKEIYNSKRPEINPDPNSAYVLREMRDILNDIVDVRNINDLTKESDSYMEFIARKIGEDIRDTTADKLKELRRTEKEDNEYI